MSSDQKETLSEKKSESLIQSDMSSPKNLLDSLELKRYQKSKSQTEQDFSSKSHSSAKQVVSQLQFNFDQI